MPSPAARMSLAPVASAMLPAIAASIAASIAGPWASPARADVPAYAPPALQLRSNIVDGFNLPAGSSFNSGTPAIADDGSVGMRLIVVGDSGLAGVWRGPGDG